MGKQLSDVSSKYGAPMGRRECRHFDESKPRSISCFRVRLDNGGYDDGGAYWGHGTGTERNLYCLRQDDTDYIEFYRAGTRSGAIRKANVPHELLKVRPKTFRCEDQ